MAELRINRNPFESRRRSLCIVLLGNASIGRKMVHLTTDADTDTAHAGGHGHGHGKGHGHGEGNNDSKSMLLKGLEDIQVLFCALFFFYYCVVALLLLYVSLLCSVLLCSALHRLRFQLTGRHSREPSNRSNGERGDAKQNVLPSFPLHNTSNSNLFW